VSTFLVEDGTGVEGANAYVDLAYARAYHEDRGQVADWDGTSLSLSITEADKDDDTVTIAGADLPDGLELLTDYWVVVASSSTLQLAASYDDAVAVSPVVVDIGPGEGTPPMGVTSPDFQSQREAIVRATDYVEARWGDSFLGEPLTDDQGLHWPADGAFYRGEELTGVPEVLKRAIAEYALHEQSSSLQVATSSGEVVEESHTLGPAVRTVKYASPVSSGTTDVPAADRLIRRLLRPAHARRAGYP